MPTPELASSTNITEDGFTANWLAVDGATSYTLQVKAMTGEAGPATVLAENFSGFKTLNANANIGNSIVDKYTQTLGWSVSMLYGTKDASARVGNANSIGYIMTPAINSSTETLVVEFDAAYFNTDGSSVVVSVLNEGNTIASETVSLTASRATYTCNFEGIPSGCNVKFASPKAGERFYLYNVNIMDMSGAGSVTTTYAGLTTTSYTIETLYTEMYYYRVQAVCDEGTSRRSEWMDVDVASEIRNMPENEIFKDNIFDLTGRRLPSIPQHGFYIREGKTYMVR